MTEVEHIIVLHEKGQPADKRRLRASENACLVTQTVREGSVSTLDNEEQSPPMQLVRK